MFVFNPYELNQQVVVLELQNTGIVYGWAKNRTIWAKAENQDKKNLFSQVGIGVKSVKFTMRKQDFPLHNALQWQGQHYFLTDINEVDRKYYEVTAAKIEPKTCIVKRPDDTKDELNRCVRSKPKPVLIFPGCLVEKYMGFSQEKPQAVAEMQYVLVTPKLIVLALADLVEIDGVIYNVQIAHTLDEYKNEYEIAVKKDV